jgi:hypothetical protein
MVMDGKEGIEEKDGEWWMLEEKDGDGRRGHCPASIA